MLRFTQDHEWLRPEGERLRVGLTAQAQESLGEIVYVDLPSVGQAVKKGGEVAVVESVKAASELYAPVSGSITAVNGDLEGDPGRVNRDPMGKGWLYEITPDNQAELDAFMDEAAYTRYVEGRA